MSGRLNQQILLRGDSVD